MSMINMEFKNENDALKYSAMYLGKYEHEIVLVDGTPTFLCSTVLPIEEYIRCRVEEAVEDFLRLFNVKHASDIAIDIGATMTDEIINKIEEEAHVKVLSNYCDF